MSHPMWNETPLIQKNEVTFLCPALFSDFDGFKVKLRSSQIQDFSNPARLMHTEVIPSAYEPGLS